MSHRTRNYVGDGMPMFRAAVYNAEGECTRTFGPYSTVAPARAAANGYIRQGVNAKVEMCLPDWVEVPK